MKFTLIATLLVTSFIAVSNVHAEQASNIRFSNIPATARVNANVTLSGVLQDAWDNSNLAGRSVDIEVGERYAVSSTPFNTLNNGSFSRTWKFSRPGKYRVSFKFRGDGAYSDSRVTTFIIVN